MQGSDPLDVAVMSAALWKRRFNKQPLNAGTTITLDGRPFTLLGVMPEDFQFPYRAASLMTGALPEARTDVWVPMRPLRAVGEEGLRRGRVSVIARLKPGASLSAAASQLGVIAARVEQENPGFERRVGARLAPLQEVVDRSSTGNRCGCSSPPSASCLRRRAQMSPTCCSRE